MMGARLKLQGYLFWLPIATAIVLSLTLTYGGIVSYLQELSGTEQSFNDIYYTQLRHSRTIASIGYLVLCAVYLFWLVRFPQTLIRHGNRFWFLLRPAIPFLFLAWFAYPLSNDIYLYLQYGVMTIQGWNPYVIPAGAVRTALTPLLDWFQTSTYGPVSMALLTASASAVRIHPILGVYLFKFFAVLLHIFNSYLIWRFLSPLPARNKLTIAYLLNPYVVVAQIADAHIDVLMATTIILSVGWLYQRRYIATVLMMIAGVFTKTLPILWLPLVGNFLIRQRQWRKLGISAAIGLVILAIMSQTILPDLKAWKALLNPGASGMTARSIHHLIRLSLFHLGGIDWEVTADLAAPLSTVTLIGFALFYLWTLTKPYRQQSYTEANLVRDMGWVTLVLLLFATPWLMPWYASALLPIAIFTTDVPLFCLVSLTFGLCSGVVFGAGSGNSFLSMFAVILTLFPAFGILIFHRRVLQFCQPAIDRLLLTRSDRPAVPPSQVPSTPA